MEYETNGRTGTAMKIGTMAMMGTNRTTEITRINSGTIPRTRTMILLLENHINVMWMMVVKGRIKPSLMARTVRKPKLKMNLKSRLFDIFWIDNYSYTKYLQD